MANKREMGLAEAAQTLRLPYQDAHRLVLTGRLPGRKRGGRWFVKSAEVMKLAARRRRDISLAASR